MGPGFKEIVFGDIKNTFMNPLEFGERHTIDGKPMIAVIDGLEVVERSKKQLENNRIDGVFKQQIVLYVSKGDFGLLPAVGRVLQLDKSSYRVTDAIDEGGIFSITLGAIKS